MKPLLFLPEGWERDLTYWNKTLCRMLIASEVFEVGLEVFYRPWVKGTRNTSFHLMRVCGKVVGVDTWDTYEPTATYLEEGLFRSFGGLNLHRLIKIQHYPCEFWMRFSQETGIKVVPWTIFPNSEFPLGSFEWKEGEHKFLGSITGRNERFGRQIWIDWCKENKEFYATSDLVGKRNSMEDYVKLLEDSKWGVILKGKKKNHDGKNRRECEFSSCGMPLAMDYIPTYTFPMVPEVDFVFLKEPEDLLRLKHIDPAPFAARSKRIYEERFSPKGMANTMLTLI